MQGSSDPREEAFSSDLPKREKPRRKYKVLSPPPGGEVKALVLSDRPLITRSHYQAQQTYACVGKKYGCPWCLHKIVQRIKGYLAGMEPLTGHRVLVELTDNAMYECPLISKSVESLRGRTIHLRRKGEAKNGSVFAYFSHERTGISKDKLPPAFDVKEALLSMWEIPTYEIRPSTGEAIQLDTNRYFPAEHNEIPTGEEKQSQGGTP